MSRLKKREHGGFTLLELLMVVIILAILASIALPQYIRAAEKTRAAEALQLAGAIRTAENRYKSGTSVYTGVLAELDAEMPPITGAAWMLPPMLTARSVFFKRMSGKYVGQIVGIIFDSGDICGSFEPMFSAPVPCP